GVLRVAVVGVGEVAAGTAALAVVSRMVVRAHKEVDRVEEPRLLEAEEDGVGAEQRPEAAAAELDVRPARVLVAIRDPKLGAASPTPLEDAEHVPRLRDLPARQRVEEREEAFEERLLRRRRRDRLHPLRDAVETVALAEVGVLE